MASGETESARWVREQLELRRVPIYGQVKVFQVEKGSLLHKQGLRWYAIDNRGLEIAGSDYAIAELRRSPAVLSQWPGYGMARLSPSGGPL